MKEILNKLGLIKVKKKTFALNPPQKKKKKLYQKNENISQQLEESVCKIHI